MDSTRASRRTLAALAASVVVSGGLLLALTDGAGAGSGNSTVIGSGPDFLYPGSEMLAGATATVTGGALGSGNSQITLDLRGVDAQPGTVFGAHVHTNPCGAAGTDAGPHYVDPAINRPLSHREVWLDVRIDGTGRGHSVATRNFEVPDRANRSVILHVLGTDRDSGAAGARLACIDLDG